MRLLDFGPGPILAAVLIILLNLGFAMAQGNNDSVTILALGDSLTAGYGLPPGSAFPDLLEKRLRKDGYPVHILNAGVSGDTTAQGLARLDWILSDKPDLALVELGANDALQGLDPARMKDNLDAILTKLRQRKIPTLLIGMYAPNNLGPAYAEQFIAVFPGLADKHGARLYPFILEGVAQNPEFNQDDGIHPNKAGAQIIADNLYPYVKRLVETYLDGQRP